MFKHLAVGIIEQAKVVLMSLSAGVVCRVAVGVGSGSVGGVRRGDRGVAGVPVGVGTSSGVERHLGLRLGVGVGKSHGQHGEKGELQAKTQPDK